MINLPELNNTCVKGGRLSGVLTVSNFTIYGSIEKYEDRHMEVFVKFNDEDRTELTIPKLKNTAVIAILQSLYSGDSTAIKSVTIYGLSQTKEKIQFNYKQTMDFFLNSEKIAHDLSTPSQAIIFFQDGTIWEFSRLIGTNESAYQTILEYCT